MAVGVGVLKGIVSVAVADGVAVSVIVNTAVGEAVAVLVAVNTAVAVGVGVGVEEAVPVAVVVGVNVGNGRTGVAGNGGKNNRRPAARLVLFRQFACMMAYTVVLCRRANWNRVSPG